MLPKVEGGFRICSIFMRASAIPRCFATIKPQVVRAPKKDTNPFLSTISSELQLEKQRYTEFKEGDVSLSQTFNRSSSKTQALNLLTARITWKPA